MGKERENIKGGPKAGTGGSSGEKSSAGGREKNYERNTSGVTFVTLPHPTADYLGPTLIRRSGLLGTPKSMVRKVR